MRQGVRIGISPGSSVLVGWELPGTRPIWASSQLYSQALLVFHPWAVWGTHDQSVARDAC